MEITHLDGPGPVAAVISSTGGKLRAMEKGRRSPLASLRPAPAPAGFRAGWWW
ncbi:hypothetical protein [Streptomyces sp. NPDC049590]|uniref:hypothetical protein n=1 Tax=Streptomyces sp. NPDC049590 TaxID=3154834 RepID=UPI003446B390